MGQLSFAIVRLHPLCERNKGDHLRAWGDELPRPNLAFAHSAVAWSVNFGVAKVHLDCSEARLLRAEIGLKLQLLRFEDDSAAALGFGSEFTAVQNGLCFIKISISAGK